MKKILSSLTAMFGLFFLVYLLGCFYNTTFDISKWNEDSKKVVSVLGGIFSLAAGFVTYLSQTKLHNETL